MSNFVTTCRFLAASAGAGSFVVASAVAGHVTPANAAAINGKTYHYYAQSGTQWEDGHGVNTAGTLTRVTIDSNSEGTTVPINFSVAPQVDVFPSPSPLEFSSGGVGGGYSNIVVERTANNYITINADMVAVSDASGNVRSVSVSGTVDINFSGPGGVDVGTGAANTAYNYFVIYNSTTSAVAGIFSLASNGNSPTLPTGYTFKRRIGWMVLDGSYVINAFIQRGNSFDYVSGRTVVSGTQASSAFFSLVGIVPPTATRIHGFMTSNNNNVSVFDNNMSSVFGINAAPPNACAWQWDFVPRIGTLQFGYQSSSSGASAGVKGWEDNI